MSLIKRFGGLAGVITFLGVSVFGGENVEYKINRAFIYYGDSETATCPAELRAGEVFVEIPEYQKILEENIDKQSGKYWTLLRKANARFQNAVRRIAKKEALDIIVEKGYCEPSSKDITEPVIEIVRQENGKEEG